MQRVRGIAGILFCLVLCIACSDYTPKPRGYFRIDPLRMQYIPLEMPELPYRFCISPLTQIELPSIEEPPEWINISYPDLQAKIYCSYLPIKPSLLEEVMEESRVLVVRQAINTNMIREQVYSNPDIHVYGSLFELDGESASPIQFILTDSTKNFFRGALYYNCNINADSLAPVTEYLKEDIVELIQTFIWN